MSSTSCVTIPDKRWGLSRTYGLGSTCARFFCWHDSYKICWEFIPITISTAIYQATSPEKLKCIYPKSPELQTTPICMEKEDDCEFQINLFLENIYCLQKANMRWHIWDWPFSGLWSLFGMCWSRIHLVVYEGVKISNYKLDGEMFNLWLLRLASVTTDVNWKKTKDDSVTNYYWNRQVKFLNPRNVDYIALNNKFRYMMMKTERDTWVNNGHC